MVGRASEVQCYVGRQGVAPEVSVLEEKSRWRRQLGLGQVRGGQEAREWSPWGRLSSGGCRD